MKLASGQSLRVNRGCNFVACPVCERGAYLVEKSILEKLAKLIREMKALLDDETRKSERV